MSVLGTPRRSRYRFDGHGATPQLRWQLSPYFPEWADATADDSRPPIQHPTSLALADVVHRDNLIRVWANCAKTKGQAAGPDGLGYGDYSSGERGQVCRTAEQVCLGGQYRPSAAREIYIPKQQIEWGLDRLLTHEEWLRLPPDQRRKWRNLSLRNTPDRVISSAFNERLMAAIDPILLDGVMGFRWKFSVFHVLATFWHAVRELGLTVLAQDDIQNAFPSVRITDVVEVLRRHITDLGTLQLIEAVLRGVDGLQHRVGISQGDPISPVCLNLLLHYVLDRSVHELSGPANRLWLRYADNLVHLCPSMLSGAEAIRRARQLLAPAGFTLKGEDRPLDLTRTSAELLGFRLRIQEGSLRAGLGTNALNELNQALADTQGWGSPVQAAKSVIEGWVRWYGPVWEQRDARSVTRSLMGMLTRNGLGEAASEESLRELMEAAWQDWVVFREGHPLSALVGDQLSHLHLLRAPHDD